MKEKKEKKYLISEKELKEMLYAVNSLQALEWGGVDNWSWYGESFSDYVEHYIEDNQLNKDEINEDFNIDDIVELEIKRYEEVQNG